MAGISIDFASNVAPFLRGAGDVESALDDVSSSLEDVAREARTTGERTAEALGDAAKESETAAERMERQFRDSLDTVRKKADDAGDSMRKGLGDNVKDGTRRGQQAVGEFKDEAKQNFSEVASSFSGDMDSAVDLVQGTLGGLAGSIPGVGLALGGLGAVAGTVYTQWKDRTEQIKEAFSNMYSDMKASGEDFLSEGFIQSEVDKIITGADGAATSFDKARERAYLLGIDIATVLRAWAGDAEAAATVQGAANDKLDALVGLRANVEDKAKAEGVTVGALNTAYDMQEARLKEVNSELTRNTENQDKARAAAEAGRAAIKASAETARDAADAEASYKDAVKSSADAIKTNGKDLAANRQAILDAVSAAVDYTDALKANGASAKTVDDAQRAMYSGLVDLAEQAGLTEKDARDLINTFVDFPDDIETGVTLDSAEAERRLRAIQNGNYTATVKVTTDASGVVRQIENALTGKTVRINVMPRVGRPVVDP